MIPYLLAIAGGYLIGNSRKDEQFADGGVMKDGGKLKFTNMSEEQFINKYADQNGNYPQSAKNTFDILTFGSADKSVLEGFVRGVKLNKYTIKYLSDDFVIAVKKRDIKELGGMMAKGGKLSVGEEIVGSKKMYFIYNSENGKKSKYYKSKEDAQKELNDMLQMKYAFSLGKHKMAEGGIDDDYYEKYYSDHILKVYVQGVGVIYQGNSFNDAFKVFVQYYENNPSAEMVMIDRYGGKIMWENMDKIQAAIIGMKVKNNAL